MTTEEISNFEAVAVQVESIYSEIAALSKKKPDDPLNKFKLGLVNNVLSASLKILGPTNAPVGAPTALPDDELPSHSDVTIVLGMYLGALEKFRADNIYEDYGDWYWKTSDDQNIRTGPPRKVTRK